MQIRVKFFLTFFFVGVIGAIIGIAAFFYLSNDTLKIIAVLAIPLVIFLISYWLSQKISKPIEDLHHGIEVAKKEKLGYRVGTKAQDEIGQISRAFDEKIATINQCRIDLDEQVRKQTKELRKKQKFLEEQQKATMNVLQEAWNKEEKARIERDKINTILHGIGDGVFVVDEKYNITMFNEAASAMSGFSAEEVIGKRYDKLLNFIDKDGKKSGNELIKEAMTTGQIKETVGYIFLVKKDGSKTPVDNSIAPLKDKTGRVIGCVVVSRDVTKEQEIDQAKTEFVSLASHQLKTPLTAINWYAEMLMSGDAGKLKKEQIKFLNEIYHGNQRMVNLVNALLNTSRIDLGTFAIDPKPTNFIKVANSVLSELTPQIKAKKMKIKKEYDKKLPTINADENLIRIVFQNLLSNAVKYTPEKGRVTLIIRKEKKNVFISVSDNGYGIPKKQQPKIFSKLFRADNVRAKEMEGTGLGLYIIKAIVEEGGGKIWFKSIEGKGTTFYVTLPLSGMKRKEGTKGLKAE
jgi:two-component system sensor histidine kinase VicK